MKAVKKFYSDVDEPIEERKKNGTKAYGNGKESKKKYVVQKILNQRTSHDGEMSRKCPDNFVFFLFGPSKVLSIHREKLARD